MKDKLIKITDTTIQELLYNEIILPSNYFQTFDKNAKELNIDLNDKEFEKEINEVIVDEFKISNIDKLSNAAKDAKDAISNRDEATLSKVSELVIIMQKEMKELQQQVYNDSLTKLYNRKWINYSFLNSDGTFKDDGTLILIDIKDFKKINTKHGDIIGDSALVFLTNFLDKKLKEENFDHNFVRYGGDQFILFVKDPEIKEAKTIINNARIELANYMLKSKSGHTLKIVFCYGMVEYCKRDNFLKKLEFADDKLKEDKFHILN
jgi:diguanylate cyclase (GGDEF)-like protein